MTMRLFSKQLGLILLAASMSGAICSDNGGGGEHTPEPEHLCQVLQRDDAYDTYNIGVNHNEGRTCPSQAQVTESYVQELTMQRGFVPPASYGWENYLYILNPQDQLVIQIADPWVCPAGSDPDDICTCEQSLQFAPSSTPPNNYNIADAYVVYWHLSAYGSAYSKYKFVWGDPY